MVFLSFVQTVVFAPLNASRVLLLNPLTLAVSEAGPDLGNDRSSLQFYLR